MKNRELRHKYMGVLLLALYIGYYFSVTSFTHSHIINGVTIVHSHFHTQNHIQKGTHSENEITLISELSAFQSREAVPGFTGLGLFFFLQAVLRPLFRDRLISETVIRISSRAPPSLL